MWRWEIHVVINVHFTNSSKKCDWHTDWLTDWQTHLKVAHRHKNFVSTARDLKLSDSAISSLLYCYHERHAFLLDYQFYCAYCLLLAFFYFYWSLPKVLSILLVFLECTYSLLSYYLSRCTNVWCWYCWTHWLRRLVLIGNYTYNSF